jgi:hypothetical protein
MVCRESRYNLRRKESAMNKQEYNGWSNYETWLANLWMSNDQGSAEFWEETATETYKHARAGTVFTQEEQAVLDLAHIMKDDLEGQIPETTGLFADLINAAMSEIDWHEIAEHLMADVEKETEV